MRLSGLRLGAAVRRVLGRDELPDGFAGRLEEQERVLATAVLAAGGHLVVTTAGLWLPEPDGGTRRVGWHLVSKAAWSGGTIALVEAHESADVDGVALIVDRPVRRLRLAEPGQVPQVVQERVTASIRSRHHRDLPGGGAWFVQRKVPGRDGVVLQVRPDPGTDEALVRRFAAEVARTLGLA